MSRSLRTIKIELTLHRPDRLNLVPFEAPDVDSIFGILELKIELELDLISTLKDAFYCIKGLNKVVYWLVDQIHRLSQTT